MFGMKLRKNVLEVEKLSDGLKQKVSELHLLVMSGTLTPDQLTKVHGEIKALKKQLGEQTGRVQARTDLH